MRLRRRETQERDAESNAAFLKCWSGLELGIEDFALGPLLVCMYQQDRSAPNGRLFKDNKGTMKLDNRGGREAQSRRAGRIGGVFEKAV